MSDPAERAASFGPNVWLIDEMYREYLEHPERLSEGWREFFSDYRPAVGRPTPVPAAETVPREEIAPPLARPEVFELPPGAEPLRGAAARIVDNMEKSLAVPTATSVRNVQVKLLEENRALMNQHLAEGIGGKVTFTHLIAWAIVKALAKAPGMRSTFAMFDGEPYRVVPGHVNLGLAVDVLRRDGTRALLVPCIKQAETMGFAEFFAGYNELLRKITTNQLSPEDFAGTNVTLTNPGMLGTSQSVPRLMSGQSCIIAAGSIAYPPEYEAADPATVARLGISKVMTLTSTYDHRVIQGAESGAFLGALGRLLAGEDDFYLEIFASLRIPHEPFRLGRDVNPFFSLDGRGLVEKQSAVQRFIHMYRVRGHLIAHINPLADGIPTHPELELSTYGLTLWDLDRVFLTYGLGGRDEAALREILAILREAYCGMLSVEYMHIQEPDQKAWIQARVEGQDPAGWLTREEKHRTLMRLADAEAFERFLGTKYIGHKRFSLEGAESLIPMLDRLLTRAVATGMDAALVGMSHRGRLNVLANILGKSYEKIFREFEGDLDPDSREGTGDVKYHLGARSTVRPPGGGEIDVRLASNPSHLESVDPVVEGMARAVQDVRGDAARERVLPILVHGDAAFAGQGVVAETLNMSALPGYRTGGTIHIVVNNGIGFTTSPVDARSSVYATDVARMVQAPIFHVNGEDPEACVHVMDLVLAFRQAFKKDVVVDMICYRRHGHNEGDEPAFTQPLMYDKIRDRRSVRKLYTEALVNRGDITLDEAEKALERFHATLEAAFEATRESAPPDVAVAAEPLGLPPSPPPAPAVDGETLERVLRHIISVPDGFKLHPKLKRQFERRAGELRERGVDWGMAESLAFGTILLEGVPIRLSGQDTRRGTFSQRHAVYVDQGDGHEVVPLQHLADEQASFLVYDSLLSEFAVLGFEYGYSVARPEALVLWEAQFGDFANGGQVIIDQYVAAAEEKWGQRSRLGLLLPHGYEGQGPEHSSGRIERFLCLSAQWNMRVAVPSTAAQYFHLLRSQAHLPEPKPLVVFTPKSMLRADAARSVLADFTDHSWRPVLPDGAPPADPRRVLLASGKIAHELEARRAEVNDARVAILRVEQLYPFPGRQLAEQLARFPHSEEMRWVQEEPANMGAWRFIAPDLAELAEGRKLTYVGRPSAASPATGSARRHAAEQERVLADAFRA
jgi:multifunctional 2-oxoglutarate metabolism enzyme